MASFELLMPKMGESIMEATVLSWLKNVGEFIEQDESVLEVATDKVDTEIPSTHSGFLTKILANSGDIVNVGTPIAIISTNENDTPPQPISSKNFHDLNQKEELTNENNITQTSATQIKSTLGRFYSPLVMSIAKKEAIDMIELEKILGTGKEGRVTKKDLSIYLSTHKVAPTEPVKLPPPIKPHTVSPQLNRIEKSPPVFTSSNDEIIEMDRMRKMIANRMVASKHTSPHVTSFVEADMTAIVNWRNKIKNKFEIDTKEKITYTPIILQAVVKAIKDFPMVNVSVDGDKIIKKKNINIGVAVALPSGNLIVPVIHDADQYNLIGLVKKMNDLVRKARENKLSTDDVSSGTYTISNVGSFGNVMGTPIIMQPQVAIMALGAIIKKPAVIESSEGDMIAIRQKMFLSHSYDHRVVDGALGGKMVRKVADYLENFDINQSY